MNLKNSIKNLFLISCGLTSGLYAAQGQLRSPRRHSCPSPQLYYRECFERRTNGQVTPPQRITPVTAHFYSWSPAQWHEKIQERRRAQSAESAASPHVDRPEPSLDLAMSYAVLQVTDGPAPQKEHKEQK